MTQDEFIHQYHEYQTMNVYEAKREAAKVNAVLNDGSVVSVVVVGFPFRGSLVMYCLMLDIAACGIEQVTNGGFVV